MRGLLLGRRLHQKREDEYLTIIKSYKTEDQQRFPQMMATLVALLDHEPQDVLGQLYMELELGNKDQGQFFTPSALSELMANLVLDEPLDEQAVDLDAFDLNAKPDQMGFDF